MPLSQASTAPAPRRGNLAALGLTRAVIAGSGVVANLALIELLPRETFGVYRWIWSTVVIATFASNLGLGHWVNREVSRDPHAAAQVVPAALRTTRLLSLLTGLGLAAWFALTRPGEPDVLVAGALGALTLGFNASNQIHQGAVHGLRKMFVELPSVMVGRVVFVITQVGLALAGFGLVPLYAGRALAAGLQHLVLARHARGELGPLVAAREPGELGRMVTVGRAFGATVLFSAVSAQADIVMLGLFCDDVEVARYGAPAAVLLQLAFVANVFSRGWFPRMARLVGQEEEAGRELASLLRMLLLVSVPVAVGGMWLAGPLLGLLRGGAYADAWGPFVLLLAAVPVRFASNGLGFSLTALDQQHARARLDGLGAVLNVLLNLAAIPVFGAEGAAATTLVTDLVLLALVSWRVRTAATIPSLVGPMARVVLAAGGMLAVLWALPDALHPLLAVLVGAVSYPVVARLVGAWAPADLKALRRV